MFFVIFTFISFFYKQIFIVKRYQVMHHLHTEDKL